HRRAPTRTGTTTGRAAPAPGHRRRTETGGRRNPSGTTEITATPHAGQRAGWVPARATVTTGPPASPRSAANGATQPARATEAHQRTPAAPTKASGVHTPSTRRHAKPA
ncbi:hypothetical protein OSH24_24435, partial [Mycobacterium ulcerans]